MSTERDQESSVKSDWGMYKNNTTQTNALYQLAI